MKYHIRVTLTCNRFMTFIMNVRLFFFAGAYSKYPDDFVPRKRNSIDIRLFEELTASKDLTKISPRDFRKISSPSFHKMSFDKAGSERRIERMIGQRKASLEFRKSPDFRRGDYR